MPDRVVCFCCQTSVAKHQVVSCNICKNIYFHECVNLTTAEVRALNSKSKSLSWTCNNCKLLSGDINQLKTVIADLQKEIHELKAKLTANKPTSTDSFEEILNEFEERHKRKRNVIIYGIAEQDSSLNKESRIAEENNTIKNVLSSISSNISLNNIRCHRLGKFNRVPGTPRPVKVVLNNSDEVYGLIKKFSTSKENNRHGDISLSFDRTPRQVELYKKLKLELEDRKNSGENGLKIKYSNGTPKIVSLN